MQGAQGEFILDNMFRHFPDRPAEMVGGYFFTQMTKSTH